ncbi:hypothetical protein GVAMD_0631 [Gardnerella vaginalis AMD]|nr:hypothetical protein GVAMD_0631 [Gardnerella vaginalis AMD]
MYESMNAATKAFIITKTVLRHIKNLNFLQNIKIETIVALNKTIEMQ